MIEPLLIGVETAATALGLRRSKLYELIATGRLKSVKVGTRRLIPADAMHEFVASLEAEQGTDADVCSDS